MKKLTLPKLKRPKFQEYILYINSSFIECITNDLDHIVDLILENKVSIITIQRNPNNYGLTDYNIICG